MDRSKKLLINGKDRTGDVRYCKYNPSTQKYDVTFFKSKKIYSYSYSSIKWVENRDKIQDTIKNYLKELASVNELKNDDGEVLLKKQYEKLGIIGEDTVMAVYMNPKEHKVRTYQTNDFIFPFGGNASQFKAVANALSNQVSIIQGPPGTGKTQTILNIIANLLVMGKTVQIVSNNNSATLNVLEKLSNPSYGLGFLVAPLGKRQNKEEFINKQSGVYPTLTNWKINTVRQFVLKTRIKSHVKKLSKTFSVQERLAQARREIDSLNLEIRYFEQYCSETNLIYPKIKQRHRLNSKKIMRLWQNCYRFLERERAMSFWFKIKSVFIYGIFDWNFYKNDTSVIITVFQNLFYHFKQLELNDEITMLESQLSAMDAKNKMANLSKWSLEYLRTKLFERFRGGKHERTRFSEEDLWKCPDSVVQEYPIILSTTFSSCSSLNGVIYDYLIMDEASQVDVATGALALSCAKNAVIVGDLKQLPNVVKRDMKKRCDEIFNTYNLPQGYSFSENSFLKSICSIIIDAPQTLLREHYRCHPKIIGFCNQKFYNNELVIMTEDHGEPDALTVLKTVEGNHKRDRINQRQIDVTVHEALPRLSNVNPEDIGIIAPYRDQVYTITRQLGSRHIEVDTVHKFQGREKDTILLTTVDDVVTDFSDDPYLLNVAVSRAKKRLSLVVSGNEQPANSNVGDLISYIEYNNFNIIQSKIRSIFDLLYRQYTDVRMAFLKRHSNVSVYESENLMYGEIVNILKRHSELSLNIICHQPLNMLIMDSKCLSDEERKYAMNPATHIDFLLYSQVTKKPVLAIEVDGFHFHKHGTDQHERDKLKNHILELYGIPLRRFPTNGSGECAEIERFLVAWLKKSVH